MLEMQYEVQNFLLYYFLDYHYIQPHEDSLISRKMPVSDHIYHHEWIVGRCELL